MTTTPLIRYQTLIDSNKRDWSEINEIHSQTTMQMLQAAFIMGQNCQSLKDHAAILSIESKKLINEITQLKLLHETEWQAVSDNMHAKIEPLYSKTEAVTKYFQAMILEISECHKLAEERNRARQFIEEGRTWTRLALARTYTYYFSQITTDLKMIDALPNSLALKMKNLKWQPVVPFEKVVDKQIVPSGSSKEFFAMVVKQKESLEHQNTLTTKHNESLANQIAFLKDTHADLSKENALVSLKIHDLIDKVKKYRVIFDKRYQEDFAKNKQHTSRCHNSDFTLAGMYLQGYEMAKEAMDTADEVIDKLEQILKV